MTPVPLVPLVVTTALRLRGAFYSSGYLVHFTHNDVADPRPLDRVDVGLMQVKTGADGSLNVERALKAALVTDGYVAVYSTWADVPEDTTKGIVAHAGALLVQYMLERLDPRPAPPGRRLSPFGVPEWELIRTALATAHIVLGLKRTAEDVTVAPLPGDKFHAYDGDYTCVREPWIDHREWPKRWMVVDKNDVRATVPLSAWTTLARAAKPQDIHPV